MSGATAGDAEAADATASASRLWLVGYGVATFLSFPHFVAGQVVDLGLLAAWLGPACLFVALDGMTARQTLLRVGLASTLTHAAIFHWIYVVTVTYGHAPPVVGVLAPLGLALYPALFVTAMAWTLRRFARVGFAGPFVVATVWTAFEYLRFFAFTGFPWAIVGYAQHANPGLLPLAAWTGVHGLSFATALGGAALARVFLQWRAGERPDRAALAGLATVVVLHGVGWIVTPATFDDAPGIEAAALQGDIDQAVKWSPEWAGRTLEIYDELSRRTVEAGAEVVLWPETAVPGAIEMNATLRDRLSRLAQDTGATLLVGGVGAAFEPNGRLRHVYDSAFVFAPTGEVMDRYDKTHLVPFGEYVPFRDLLGRFIGAVARGIAATDVSPGGAPRVVELPGPIVGRSPPHVGVPICYELLFPDLVRQFVLAGGGVLLAITNDAWYGRTGAPYQFLAITLLRSVETGLWTVRAANSGVSAIIDPRGRVRQQTPIFERGHVQARVPLRPVELGSTFYVRHGDWFAIACWIIVVLLAGTTARRRPEVA